MNPLETAMWRGEQADPRLRSNVALLELLDVTPEWDRLVAAHEWATRMVPRLRQRVVEPALGVGAPAWVTVDRVDIAEHLSRAHLMGSSTRELLDLVQEFVREAVRPQPPAVARAAGRGAAGRGSGVRGGHPPQRHRRAGRDPAHEQAAQPHP